MKKKMLSLAMVALVVSGSVMAQAGRNRNGEKDEITIHRNSDSKGKTTIVIDGDEVTVNGVPLEKFKGGDVEVHMRKHFDGSENSFRIPGSDLNFGLNNLAINTNKAVLGVYTDAAENGAKITSVTKESAADQAGLKEGDVITQLNDTKITGRKDLINEVGKYNPGDKVKISYLRNGKTETVTATLKKTEPVTVQDRFLNGNELQNLQITPWNELRGTAPFGNFRGTIAANTPRLGLHIQDLENGKGVKVTGVDEDSPAEKAGIRKDDIISSIDGETVNSVDEMPDKVRSLHAGDTVKLTYQRSGRTETAEVKLPKKLRTANL